MSRVKGPRPVEIDSQMIRTGLRRVLVRGLEPVMLIAKPQSLKLMSMSGPRLMMAWEHALEGPVQRQYYLLPPLVVSFLSSDLARSLEHVTLAATGEGHVLLGLNDAHGHYELRWQTDASLFPTPTEFAYMVAPPRNVIDVSYLDVNDAAHRAVAKLLSIESAEPTPRNKLAILVDFSPSKLSIDGQTLELGIKGRYFFDPRLIIRALDSIHSSSIRVGLTRLPGDKRAVLAFLSEDDEWRVHCSLLSIGRDTQRLYPLPMSEA
jgi:hypothetical protein